MRSIALSISLLLLMPPAFAGTFEDLTGERNTLFNKVMSGAASSDDVSRFQSVTQQIKDLLNQKFSSTTQQYNQINQGLGGLEIKNENIQNSLFGGKPINSYSAPTRTSQPNNSSNLSVGNGSGITLGTGNFQIQAPGGVITGGVDQSSLVINQLVSNTIQSKSEYIAVQKQVEYYSGRIQKLTASGKDTFNYLIPYRGFGPSSDAGKIILDEEVKTKGLSAALYKEQLIIDQTHLQIMTAIMQVAQDGNNTGKGYIALQALIGEEGAAKIYQNLTQMVVDYPLNSWDISTMSDKHQLLLKAAVDKDATVQDIVDSVHKYTKRGLASKIIMPALGIASMIPMFVGPVARGALATYIMVNGGSNEEKMMKELYLGERLESRMNLLNEECHLVVSSSQLAKATNNQMLAATAQSLAEAMAPEAVNQVFN